MIKDVSFHVRKGEIVGIAGLMGTGRTELAMSLFGHSYGRNISGTVRMGGREVDTSSVTRAIAAGLAYVTEDRKQLGLVLDEPIVKNITLANLAGVATRNVISRGREQQVAEEYRRAMSIRTPSVFQKVVNLSGGNQQKVVLSKWLFTDPQVLILDEPTRGIDVAAKQEIMDQILRLAQAGMAVLFISSEMSEVVRVAHRIVVLRDRRKVGELPAGSSEDAVYDLIAAEHV